MTDAKFAVVFRGDIVMGQSLPEVKQRLQSLFKADSARIDSLFTGKPAPIKSGLSQADADRYQQLLHKAGAVVSVEPVAAKAVKQQASAKPAADEKPVNQTHWQLAPVGSVLGQSQPSEQVVEVNVDHLDVLPQQGNLINDNERPAEPEAIVNADNLDWELSADGEALLKAEERSEVAEVDVDTSQLSLAQPGGDLLDESEKQQPVTTTIDTSHLQLSDRSD